MLLNPPPVVVIIPCYNHGSTIQAVMASLRPYQLPMIVVDDGCSEPDRSRIAAAAAAYADCCTLLTHPRNAGKGAAVATALQEAQRQGFAYALQIDADGQHDIKAVPRLLQLLQEKSARAASDKPIFISGRPVYDASIPTGRKIGRYITHFWVWVETLSFKIKDSMCGLRIYPVRETLALCPQCGRRMDFDTEIMVRLYWQGIEPDFLPVQVIYPPHGISNFRMLQDNLQISLMHTRLVCSMLLQLPQKSLAALRGGRRS